MNVPFVDLQAQYRSIRAETEQSIQKVLDKGDFILGEDVQTFEQEFAAYCENRCCVGVASGTEALWLGLLALGIKPGDEVITAANTFIATALAITMAGARPVLVDIDPLTYNIDPRLIEKSITEKTRAIIPVHLYGQPADMDKVQEIARRNDLLVLEDACQAHGARYKGKRAGSFGEAAAFSFYPGKNLGAYGDGGAVVTGSEEIAARLKMLRDYGQEKKYHHIARGYNSRLDTVQAAVLRVKLRRLDDWNEKRQSAASLYREMLASTELVLPPETKSGAHVYHLYVVRTTRRDAMLAYLKEQSISTGIHYPIPIHLQPSFSDLGYQRGDFPLTEAYADELISLPMFPEITKKQIQYVTDKIKHFLRSNKKGV